MRRGLVKCVVGLSFIALMGCSLTQMHRQRGDRLFQKGEYGLARQEYVQLESVEGRTFFTVYRKAQCSWMLSDYGSACPLFEEARALKPDFPDTYVDLARCYDKTGNEEKELETWKALQRIAPDHPAARLRLAEAAFEDREYATAEEHYKVYLKSNGQDATAHGSLGAVLSAQGRFKEAAAALEQAEKIDRANLTTHFNLGVAYMGMGRFYEAQDRFTLVTLLSPELVRGWINLAAARCHTGDRPRALEALRNAVAQGYTDSEALLSDDDFRPLWTDEVFLALVEKMEEEKTRAAAQAETTLPGGAESRVENPKTEQKEHVTDDAPEKAPLKNDASESAPIEQGETK